MNNKYLIKIMQNSFNWGQSNMKSFFKSVNSVKFYDDSMFNFETIPSHENEEHVIKNCMKKAAYVFELMLTCNPLFLKIQRVCLNQTYP